MYEWGRGSGVFLACCEKVILPLKQCHEGGLTPAGQVFFILRIYTNQVGIIRWRGASPQKDLLCTSLWTLVSGVDTNCITRPTYYWGHIWFVAQMNPFKIYANTLWLLFASPANYLAALQRENGRVRHKVEARVRFCGWRKRSGLTDYLLYGWV